MTLFVCNATPRDHHLNYRVPGNERVFDRIIEKGTQFEIPHKAPEEEAHIIKQLEAYGAVKPARVAGNKEFSGLIYSDKPIKLDEIRNGLATIDENAVERALKHRTAAAVGSDKSVAKLAQESGASASSFEVEIMEQPRPGVDDSDLQKNRIEVVREQNVKPGRKKKDRS